MPNKPKFTGNQVNGKKAKSSCWDCGQQGHWSGDHGCPNPGAGLFKPKSNSAKPQKHVRVAEALTTEMTVDAEGDDTPAHEVMTTSRVSRPSTLAEALQGSHEVHVGQLASLSLDKRLMGALDSACNRTCCGSAWVEHYLAALQSAPEAIQQLVSRSQEQETFKFGDGGTQKSSVRIRLPMVVGTDLVLTWVSIIPVGSLGLLLGRDWLDGVGCVLSFSKRVMRADHLSGHHIPLKQLAAGHFALRLIPSEWPIPGKMRWRRVGQDGVVALQISHSDWLQRKLLAVQSLSTNSHEHLLSEHSVCAAKLVGVSFDDGSCFDDLAHSMAQTPTATPTSTTSTSSSPNRAAALGIHGGGTRRPLRLPVEENHHPSPCKTPMARARHLLMVMSAALASIHAISIPFHQQHHAVAASSPADGFQRSHVQTPSSKSSSMPGVHSWKLEGSYVAQGSPWMADILRGGPDAAGYVGRKVFKRSGEQDSSRSRGRSQSIGHQGQRGGQGASSGEGTHRSKRRFTGSQNRPPEAGIIASRLVQREDDCRAAQSRHQACGSSTHGKSSSVIDDQQFKWSKFSGGASEAFQSSILGSPDHRSSARTCTVDAFDYSREPWDRSQNARCSRTSFATRSKVPGNAESGHDPHDVLAGESNACRDSDSGHHALRHDRQRFRDGRPHDAWMDSAGDCSRPRGRIHDPRGNAEVELGSSGRPEAGRRGPSQGAVPEPLNPWAVHQELKPGLAQMISQAWEKHCRDRALISKTRYEVLQTMHEDWNHTMSKCFNEHFIMRVEIGPSQGPARRQTAGAVAQAQRPSPDPRGIKKGPDKPPLVGEIYTATSQVARQAKLRGHRAATSMSLESGWDFQKAEDRKACIRKVMEEDPFCLVLAFPCGPWSPLTRLRASSTLDERRQQGRVLLNFALLLARIQLKRGAHVLLENPRCSLAWSLPELVQFVEQPNIECVDFDQCAFKLRSADGLLHKKPTRIATSSSCIADELQGMVCSRDHAHQPVIGGSKITSRAGHYPVALAKAIVRGLEKQFHVDHGRCREVLAVDGAEEERSDDGGDSVMDPFNSESEISSMDDEGSPETKIPSAIRLAVKRLHENTGHRSNRRLARALVLSGAPKEVVLAAKSLKCSICDEKKRPKSRRPTSLPTPKDVSDQVHLDIFESVDVSEQRFYIVHCIDWTSRFQMAEVLETKDSDSIVNWFQERWMSIFGPPRVIVADQGREFVSWVFQEMCDRHSILLHHIPVQAPWCNGVCERGGGILKGLLECCVKSRSVAGLADMKVALQECVLAYNADINELGVSPAQAAIGRQPRMIGDVLGNFGQRLAEHGLIDGRPSLARQVALRETARIAMTRLHFSKGIRKAELARSRSSTMTQQLEPGDIVYFWRESKYNSRTSPSKKRLSLRRWHGPALLVALEGHNAGYVSFKGQLSKCAREHLRSASSMEQISADVWHDAIQECVEAALHDVRRPQSEAVRGAPITPALPDARESSDAMPAIPETKPFHDLPPVAPAEVIQALDGNQLDFGSELPASSLSRRASAMSSAARAHSRQSSGAAPGTPVPALITGASQVPATPPLSSRMEESVEAARELEAVGKKRAAELEAETLREGSGFEAHVATTVLKSILKTKNDLVSQYAKAHKNDSPVEPQSPHYVDTLEADIRDGLMHPLKAIQQQVDRDKQNPELVEVQDHGNWSGQWPLPSRSSWMAHETCCVLWPSGGHEVNAAKTARREVKWRNIPLHERDAYRQAAETGWKVQTDNGAFEILTDAEAQKVRARLKAAGQMNKILTPRYIYTDKNDGLRSDSNPLPLLANARVVIPGYQDETAYAVRKDAPTSSRCSQHILFITAAAKGWTLWSADVKSAFLKGELFQEGERELYIGNIRATSPDEPLLPFSPHGLAKVRKGVFGLADSPRRWYLRLNKSLTKLGWLRSSMDAAQWFLKSPDGTLDGIVVSHVDDLLRAGTAKAHATLKALGEELGFGSLETGSFTYCGKLVQQLPEKSIEVSVRAYHENMQPVSVPIHRKKQLDAQLTPSEHRQLRAILGSLQWVVAQVRWDMGYQLSVLQGEPSVVKTLLRANALVRLMKQDAGFKLKFGPMCLDGAGILIVSDASLGNVTRSGGADGSIFTKVFSQAAYLVLVGDRDLMEGREGKFGVLDSRSHRLSRVCRSTFGAELLGTEEAFDAGLFCRGLFAEAQGFDVLRGDSCYAGSVPLGLVSDAKDVFDKSVSDTPTYGSQKSLAFSVAWVREVLRKDCTRIHWTSTENMLIDCGTKEMNATHLKTVLDRGSWSITYNPSYVKQTLKPTKPLLAKARNSVLPGRVLSGDDPILSHLQKLAERPGWHVQPPYGIHVCRNAVLFRTPNPRFSKEQYPLRTSYGRFDNELQAEWRILEDKVRDGKLEKIGDTASVLVTFFGPESQNPKDQQKKGSAEKEHLPLG